MTDNYKNKFILYFKTKKITTLCKKYNIDVSNVLFKNIYEQIGDLISTIAINFIQQHNSSLVCTDITHNLFNYYGSNIIYSMIHTNPNVNHPYMCFADTNGNYIGLILPFGNDINQVPNDYLKYAQESGELLKLEYTLLYKYFDKTINLRIDNILKNGQYSLVSCTNIVHCSKKKNEINKLNISTTDKKKRIEVINDYYKKKAIRMLTKYFSLLGAEKYSEAREYLNGKGGNHNGKYYGRERLNTFFKTNRGIIGHLEVFINLYKKKIELFEGSMM